MARYELSDSSLAMIGGLAVKIVAEGFRFYDECRISMSRILPLSPKALAGKGQAAE